MSKRILITFGGAAYDRQILRTLGYCHQGTDSKAALPLKVYDDRWLIGQPFYRDHRSTEDTQSVQLKAPVRHR